MRVLFIPTLVTAVHSTLLQHNGDEQDTSYSQSDYRSALDRFPNTQLVLVDYGLGDFYNDTSMLEDGDDFGLNFKPISLDFGSNSGTEEYEEPATNVTAELSSESEPDPRSMDNFYSLMDDWFQVFQNIKEVDEDSPETEEGENYDDINESAIDGEPVT